MLTQARECSFVASEYLERNDSYSHFEQIDGHLKTGLGNTNGYDLQVVLVAD